MGWQDRDYHRDEYSEGGAGRHFGDTPVTWTLIIINTLVFVLDGILFGSQRAARAAPFLWGNFNIDQAISGYQVWRFVTFQFLHNGLFHYAFNMIGLYFFGRLLESHLRSARFATFYLLCGCTGAVMFTLLASVPGLLGVTTESVLVGASGGLFGVLVGCAMLFPHQRVMLLLPPIPMSMRTMAFVFLGISLLSITVGSQNAGGEAAHLGGAVLGAALIRWPGLIGFSDSLNGNLWGRMKQKQAAHRRNLNVRKQAEEDAEVDRILDKVRQHGLHSLSRTEKKTLQRATERQRHVG